MSGSGRRVPRPTESKVHALSKPAASMLRAASARLAAPKGGPLARPVGSEMPNLVMAFGGHHSTANGLMSSEASPPRSAVRADGAAASRKGGRAPGAPAPLGEGGSPP